ncbi:hypothetical protein BY458DRAFT_525492 [Sporodiniella umbellata]|nr:hypothetical protein BY458DRAFT_525492 [Sporodiniella umbellata]
MTKSVTFYSSNTVYSTYSAEEYDRSHFPSSQAWSDYITPFPKKTVCSKFITEPQTHQNSRSCIKPLDLSSIPNARRRALSGFLEPTT